MAENVTIARPYAEAVFRLATETKGLAAWSDRLAQLAAVAAAPEMRACIGNPNLSSEQLGGLFKSLAGGDAPETGNFVDLLVRNGRLAVLPEIKELFDALRREHENAQEAQILSAFPMDDAQLKSLTESLEKKFGKRISAVVKVDPELIGGVCVTVGDEVMDASVRGKLNAMASALKH